MSIQRAPAGTARTYARTAGLYAVSFLASEASTALQHQDEAVVQEISRSSDGIYVLTLGPRYKRVYAWANVEKTGDWNANVHTVTEGGAAANAVTVEAALAGTADDPEAAITVLLWLVLADSDGT